MLHYAVQRVKGKETTVFSCLVNAALLQQKERYVLRSDSVPYSPHRECMEIPLPSYS